MAYKNKSNLKTYGKKYYQEHKKHKLEYQRKYYKKVKETKLKYAKNYRDLHPDVKRKSDLKLKFGLTLFDYNIMFNNQDGCCAICGRHQSELTRALAIDHNHNTNEVRGLLCGSCNTAIGSLLADDGIKLLQNAIKYVSKYEKV